MARFRTSPDPLDERLGHVRPNSFGKSVSYQKLRILIGKIYQKSRTIARLIYRNPQAIPGELSRYVLKIWPIWPPQMADYISTWWRLVSGNYGMAMRVKLETRLALVAKPQPGRSLRVFHGLYHILQPVFMNQGLKAKGIISTYETLNQNPDLPAIDGYYRITTPDFQRERVTFVGDSLIRLNPLIPNAANLDQLEALFLERWPNYDIFHFNQFLSFLPDNIEVEFIRRSGRPVYFHFRNCSILTKIIPQFTEQGQTVAQACQHCQQRGWRAAYFSRFQRGVRHASRIFTSTPNLCHCSPEFEHVPNTLEPGLALLPPPTPKSKQSGEPIIIMHLACDKAAQLYKGTPHVLKAIDTLKAEGLNVALKLVQKMNRVEAVKLYQQADIFVEQLHLGAYGNAAIEAMAFGLPVISSHAPAHAHLCPGCPIVHANPLTLTERLRELALNPRLRAEIGQRSYEWVRKFHSNKQIAAHLLRIYEEDLGWRTPEPRNTLSNLEPKYGG
ncbi:MAG: glycosyltransferase family 4 protein [Anaerolineae bacterium]